MLSHAEIANRQEVLSLEEILVLLQRFYEIFYAFLKIIKFELGYDYRFLNHFSHDIS